MNKRNQNKGYKGGKKNDPLLPVTITFSHMQRDLIEAKKAHRKFTAMGECMWAADWERLCNQISAKIQEYNQLYRRYEKEGDEKFLKWAENVLRNYEHRPFKKPKNLSHVTRDGVLVRVQQKDYHRPSQFQGVTC